jgi:hypothetical protein
MPDHMHMLKVQQKAGRRLTCLPFTYGSHGPNPQN